MQSASNRRRLYAQLLPSPSARLLLSLRREVISLNRYGSEAEIATVLVFLCSEQATYITGHVIVADGGFDCAGVGLPALRA